MNRKLQKMFGCIVVVLTMLSTSLNDGSLPAMAEAKRARCTNQLKKGEIDFFYCTKFAVAKYT